MDWLFILWVIDGIMHTATLIGSLWFLNRAHLRAESRLVSQSAVLNEVLAEVGQLLGESRHK